MLVVGSTLVALLTLIEVGRSCDLSTGQPFIYDWQISEDAGKGALIGELPLVSPDASELRLVQGAPHIRLVDQALYLEDAVDRDQGISQLRAMVECTSLVPGDQNFKVNISVDIMVLDANDNAPVFDQTEYFINVTEELPKGTVVFDQLLAVDQDQPGENRQVTYEVIPDKMYSHLLTIEQPWIGKLSVASRIDYEEIQNFSVKIRAKDNGKPPQNSTAVVHVQVLDVDDLNPEFDYSEYYAVLDRDTKPGATVNVLPAPILAHDNDTLNATVEYFLEGYGSERFAIDVNGTLTLEADLPDDKTIILQVKARQKYRHERQSAASLRITIAGDAPTLPSNFFDQLPSVVTSNKTSSTGTKKSTEPATTGTKKPSTTPRAPVIRSLRFSQAVYNVTIKETQPTGEPILRVKAAGSNSQDVLYSILDTRQLPQFELEPNTGALSLTVALDYEKDRSFRIPVQATDGLGLAEAYVDVIIEDVNDHAPVFTNGGQYEFSIDSRINNVAGRVQAEDDDANDQVFYTLLNFNDLFQISPNGEISAQPDSLEELVVDRTYELVVVAQDAGSPPHRTHANARVTIVEVDAGSTRPQPVVITGNAVQASEAQQPAEANITDTFSGWYWIVALTISLMLIAFLFTALIVFAIKHRRALSRHRHLRYPQYVLPQSRWMKPDYRMSAASTDLSNSTGPLALSTGKNDQPHSPPMRRHRRNQRSQRNSAAMVHGQPPHERSTSTILNTTASSIESRDSNGKIQMAYESVLHANSAPEIHRYALHGDDQQQQQHQCSHHSPHGSESPLHPQTDSPPLPQHPITYAQRSNPQVYPLPHHRPTLHQPHFPPISDEEEEEEELDNDVDDDYQHHQYHTPQHHSQPVGRKLNHIPRQYASAHLYEPAAGDVSTGSGGSQPQIMNPGRLDRSSLDDIRRQHNHHNVHHHHRDNPGGGGGNPAPLPPRVHPHGLASGSGQPGPGAPAKPVRRESLEPGLNRVPPNTVNASPSHDANVYF